VNRQFQAVSDDGRYTVFTSNAANLVPGQVDTNNASDVFLYDRVTDATLLVSGVSGSVTTTGNSGSFGGAISGNGTVIAFTSLATNLVAGQIDGSNTLDTFEFDRLAGTTTLVSRNSSSATTTGNGVSFSLPAISGNGAVIAFTSSATNLVAGQNDSNGSNADVFAFDRLAGTTTLVSRASGSATTTGNDFSGASAISARGAVIAFASRASDLVPGDVNGFGDVFTYVTPPRVQSAQINDGAAQRSRVTTLQLTFSTEVTFAGPVASAFTLTRNGGGAVIFTATANLVNGVTVVTLNSFTGSEAQFGSLNDGRYTLTALASQISTEGFALDGDGDGQPGGDYHFGDAQGLFRFYGDINGDRHVDIADFGLFSSTFNLSTGQTGFLAAFDFNGDGHIDIADFGQFSIRFFTVLP
jgi:hypothetical protein